MIQKQAFVPNLPPEEQVRQYVYHLLVTTFGYSQQCIAIEFPVKMGSNSKRVDIAVFHQGKPHLQQNIQIIVECKRLGVSVNTQQEAYSQLESYMSACLNAEFGILASHSWTVFRRQYMPSGFQELQPVPALLNSRRIPTSIRYAPAQGDVVYKTPKYWGKQKKHRGNRNIARGIFLLITAGIFLYFGATNWGNITRAFGFTSDDVPAELEGIVVPPEMLQTLAAQTQRAAVVAPIASNPNSAEGQIPTAIIRQYMEVVGQQRINVRLADTTQSPVVTVLNPGQHVLRIGHNLDRTWTHVELDNGANGWVASHLLQETQP